MERIAMHIALYRSWRPQSFRDMVGQQHIIRTLQNALKEGRLSHAYLFSGPRGTGKTSAAKILAKAVNCQLGPVEEPCNECESCRRITEGSLMDVVEIDAASNNGVDEIRDLREKVRYAPTEVRHKVYIIDEVHMLSIGAFNALLKTLEEPPPHVIFILATTESYKLPATIISRCQRFDFRRVGLEDQMSRIRYISEQEGFTIEKAALEYIARLSEGGMRDALSLLDQISAYAGKQITYETVLAITGGLGSDQFGQLAAAILDENIPAALDLIHQWMQEGKSPDKCVENLMYYFRDLLMIRMMPDAGSVTERIMDAAGYRSLAERFAKTELFQAIETLNHYHSEMKYSSQARTLLEIAVMKLCSKGATASQEIASDGSAPAAPSADVGHLTQRISQLEQQLAKLEKSGIGSAAAGNTVDFKPAVRGDGPRPSSGGAVRKVKLDPFLKDGQSEWFKQVQAKWSQVLGQVKTRKITVHAWLIDGEPLAATDDAVLVGFKSAMHRETTEKPANKELIELVLSELLKQPVKMSTVMLNEWNEALKHKDPGIAAAAEPLELVHEEPGKHREEWINEAIELFGDQLVTIKDEV
jgi:DNA polymerase III subunit gamma/tau